MKSRFVETIAIAVLLLSLGGCGWLQQRSSGTAMVTAPRGPDLPVKPPDEAPVPRAAPQPAVQAAPIGR